MPYWIMSLFYTVPSLGETPRGMIQACQPELNRGDPKGSSYRSINLTTESSRLGNSSSPLGIPKDEQLHEANYYKMM